MILLVKAKMSEIKLLIHDLVRVENLRVEAQEAMRGTGGQGSQARV